MAEIIPATSHLPLPTGVGDPVEALRRITALQSLDNDELAALAVECAFRHIPAGRPMIDEGPDRHEVFFLVGGTARVTNHTLLGGTIKLSDLEAGSYFGELSAIDGGERSATVEAVTDCFVAAMPPDTFRRALGKHPGMLIHVLQNMARMIRHTNATILTHATL